MRLAWGDVSGVEGGEFFGLGEGGRLEGGENCHRTAKAEVSHLRRLGFILIGFPGLPAWAKLCRAHGAELPLPEIFLQVVHECTV